MHDWMKISEGDLKKKKRRSFYSGLLSVDLKPLQTLFESLLQLAEFVFIDPLVIP